MVGVERTSRVCATVSRAVVYDHQQKEVAMEYDDDDILTMYIWNHYQPLMTDFERLVGKAIIGRAKAEDSTNPQQAAMLQRSWGLVNDASVNAALHDGAAAFRRQVRDRLLVAHGEQIFINRCPICHRIVRTPKARLCVWCGHTWYEQATV